MQNNPRESEIPPVSFTETISLGPALGLAGIFDIELPDDEKIPPLWQWIYLLDRPPQSVLGPDGHPRVGLPTPPSPGTRRMFAGGRVVHHGLLSVGQPATRTVCQIRTVNKVGRAGPLTFVTLQSVIEQEGHTLIVEEQDLVYLPEAPGGDGKSANAEPAAQAHSMPQGKNLLQLSVTVDEALLFRFSALTYNAHRIHYDHHWAALEGYPDLVVHGPLQAVAMAELWRRNGVSLIRKEFSYRLRSPMIGPQTFRVVSDPTDDDAKARVYAAAGTLTAESELRPAGG